MQFQVQAQIHKMARSSGTLKYLGPQNYTAPLTMYLHVCANFQPNWKSRGLDTARKRIAPVGVNIHLKVQLTMTPKKVKTLTADTKSHSKFQPNMIYSFGAILAWKSDDDADVADDADADDDYDDDHKSNPYMSPSYAGDTLKLFLKFNNNKSFWI